MTSLFVNITPVRALLALELVILSFVAYALPTSATNLVLVVFAALLYSGLHLREYGRNRQSIGAVFVPFALGAIIAYLAIGAPPA